MHALLDDEEDKEKWKVINMRTGKRVYVGSASAYLLYIAETMEECMVMTVKLWIRPSDTPRGRAIKLTHYIDLYKRFFGKLPPDLHLYIRSKLDIPMMYRDEVLEYLRDVEWKPWEKVATDVTLLEDTCRKYRR